MERILRLDPLKKSATWEQIKAKRDEFEQAPIDTGYGTFDANEISTSRLSEAIEQFENLTTLVDGKLVWKLADNSLLPLSKAELEEVLSEIKRKRSIRSGQLHVKAEQFRLASEQPSVNQISDISSWIN